MSNDASISQIKQQIDRISSELKALGEPEALPEVIETTNMVRANEHLAKANQKKTELLAAYADYSTQMEGLVATVFDVQKEMKDILRIQSALIPTKAAGTKRKAARKVKAKKAKGAAKGALARKRRKAALEAARVRKAKAVALAKKRSRAAKKAAITRKKNIARKSKGTRKRSGRSR